MKLHVICKQLTHHSGFPGPGKKLGRIFAGLGKVRGFLVGLGNLERTSKVRENSVNFKFHGYGKFQENIVFLFTGKGRTFNRDSPIAWPSLLRATL